MARAWAGTRPAPTGIQRYRDASQIGGGRGQAQGLPLRGFRDTGMRPRSGGARAGTRPAPTGSVWGCWRRRRDGGRAGTRPAPTGIQRYRDASRIWGGCGQAQGLPLQAFDDSGMRPRFGVGVGRHKACPYGDSEIPGCVPDLGGRGQAQGLPLWGVDGNGGRGPAKLFQMGTWWKIDTRSARHVVGEGALRGRSPRTREGRIGPTAPKQGESGEERGESETVLGCLGLERVFDVERLAPGRYASSATV